jgi:hypothetical protein
MPRRDLHLAVRIPSEVSKEKFMSHEWKIRTHAAELQLTGAGDCAQFAVTHAMYLAFVSISIIYVPFLQLQLAKF